MCFGWKDLYSCVYLMKYECCEEILPPWGRDFLRAKDIKGASPCDSVCGEANLLNLSPSIKPKKRKSRFAFGLMLS